MERMWKEQIVNRVYTSYMRNNRQRGRPVVTLLRWSDRVAENLRKRPKPETGMGIVCGPRKGR